MAERTLTLRINVVNQQANAALAQYNAAVREAGTNHTTLGNSLTGLNDSFNKFNQALNTTVLGFSAMDVVKFGVELNRLGQQVNIASRVFTQLAGGAESSAEMLELMREKTGGVVDNMTLMAGASRLLQMGLADSKESVAGLTEMAIKLGGALGMDANKAIEDFSLLLSNVSYLRLDQFGISAGAVRARVEELKEEFPELSREARFAKAVLEEGGDAMLRLGDAAGSASTAISRFETNVTNTMQNVGSNVNKGVEGIFLFFESVGEEQERTVQRSIYLADQWNEAISGFNPEHLTERTVESFQTINDAIMSLRMSLGRMPTVEEVTSSVSADGYADVQAITYALENQFDWDEMINNQLIDRQRYLDNIARITEHMNALSHEQSNVTQVTADNEERRAQYAQEMAEAARIQREHDTLTQGSMSTMSGMYTTGLQAGGFVDVGGDLTGPQYQEQGTADQLAQLANVAEQQLEYMQDLEDATGEAVFSDEQIDQAEQYADQIGSMADEAQRAADALQQASLSDLFGQQGGGRTGELADMVIEQMRAAGMSDEEIAAAQGTFDSATGRTTAVSTAVDDVLIPALAELDPATAAIAMQNFNDMLTALAASGVDPNTVINAENILNSSGLSGDGSGTPGYNPQTYAENLMGIGPGQQPMSTDSAGYFDEVNSPLRSGGDLTGYWDEVTAAAVEEAHQGAGDLWAAIIEEMNATAPEEGITYDVVGDPTGISDTNSSGPNAHPERWQADWSNSAPLMGPNANPEAFADVWAEVAEPAAEVADDITTTADKSELFADNMGKVADNSEVTKANMDLIAKQLVALTSGPKEILLIPRIDQHALHLQLANEIGWFQLNLR